MQLPPLQVTRAVIQRYARVLHRYSSELGSRPLVIPNGDFFPDEFRGDEASVVQLAERMQMHSGMADIPITCQVVTPGTPQAEPSKCGGGSCGVPMTSTSGLERLVDTGDSWLLQVPSPELRHPVALTTNLARSLAFVFMVETQKEGELLEPPVDVTADLVAVALGFGPLMLQGSYIYAKSCGGPQIASVTKVGLGELSIAVALFAALGSHNLSPAYKVLDVTQRASLTEAARLMSSNKSLIADIKLAPDKASRTEFALEEGGSFVRGLMSKFSKKDKSASQVETLDDAMALDDAMDLDEMESLLIDMPPSSRAGRASQMPPPPHDPSKEELKRLVADELKQAGI